MSRYKWNSTTHEKELIAGAGEIDNALSATSENPVQNKVVKAALDTKASAAEIQTLTNSIAITNDADTNTQSRTLTKGTQFYKNGVLYEITSDVPVGGTLTLYSNYIVADSVTTQIDNLSISKANLTKGTSSTSFVSASGQSANTGSGAVADLIKSEITEYPNNSVQMFVKNTSQSAVYTCILQKYSNGLFTILMFNYTNNPTIEMFNYGDFVYTYKRFS